MRGSSISPDNSTECLNGEARSRFRTGTSFSKFLEHLIIVGGKSTKKKFRKNAIRSVVSNEICIPSSFDSLELNFGLTVS